MLHRCELWSAVTYLSSWPLVLHCSKTQFGSAFGSRERRAIMGYRYRDMQIYSLLDLFPFIRITTLRNRKQHGTPPSTLDTLIIPSLPNELACPQPGVRIFFAALITSLTSHFLHCPELTHTLEKLLISPSPNFPLVGTLNL